MPSVRLPAGRHRLEGRFAWSKLPETLTVPPATGLVSLTLKGRKAAARRDKRDRLWLQGEQPREAAIEDHLQVQVFRKLTDGIPVVLTTRVILEVSGRTREVVLGKALPADFSPVSLRSALPVRFEPDGRLRVQVRPGRWELDVVARHQGPLTRLTFSPAAGPWSEEEVWAFEASPNLRLVVPQGLASVDPKQTGLPAEWSGLPAFLARPGETLTLLEKRRGDPDPAPDQLTLKRALWLDFDGRGFAVQDRIDGTMTRGGRLDLLPPARLGRVAIDGVDRLITRQKDRSETGVEVRRGRLALVADSRLDKRTGRLPATGWNQDFTSVEATLNLPPGWRLLHASGADSVPGTWITQWSLLDLFVVLLVALATGKLWGWRWGAVALLSLGLAYHEPWAPRWVWLHLLAAVALLRVLPTGKLRTVAGVYRNLALLALLLLLLPFAVIQVRCGIFPQLERPHSVVGQDGIKTGVALRTRTSAVQETVQLDAEMSGRGRLTDALSKSMPSAPAPQPRERLQLHDPDAMVQTGPGLPRWRWRSIPIRWSGPVRAGQMLGLYVLSPSVNMVLAFVRVLLLGLLAWRMLDLRKRSGDKGHFRFRAVWFGLLIASTLFCALPARAEMPGPELLEQLQERLLAPAACFPHCAELQSLALNYAPDRLTLDLALHAAAHVAVPLPGERNQWTPQRVRLDGRAAPLYLDEDGRSWVPVRPGQHRLVLSGPLPERASVVLSLPLAPRQVTAAGEGWQLEGLAGQGPPSQLQLRRLAARDEQGLATLEPLALPSYFRVERTLRFGLTWTASTRVVRLFRGGGPAVVTIPLLPGEAVTSEKVPVADGQVTLNIPAGVDRVGWQSVLEVAPRLTLKAASSQQWSESWRLDVGPIWHVEAAGIPVVHHQDAAGNWLPEWRPWPEEQVVLDLSRPEGVAGQTLTVDESLLTVKPGRRATEARLKLNLRSSKGGQHPLVLPEKAELQRVVIGGRTQPIRQEGRTVTLPLVPGGKEIEIAWMTPLGRATLLRTPTVDLGIDSVNARIRLEMPRDRWVLFAGGPRLGPAVLFWGVLLVLLPIAFGLGRTTLTPLKFHHWLLLGVGLTQLGPVNALLVVGWLLALGVRRKSTFDDHDWGFNFSQIALAVLTLFALWSLVVSIQQGLLGYPHMQISGNGSSAYLLNWYQDRAGQVLPRAWVLSVPLLIYRLLMLGWALWLALSLLRWLQWGWQAFSSGGLWRPVKVRRALKAKGPGQGPDRMPPKKT
jgi:hypothetical protein